MTDIATNLRVLKPSRKKLQPGDIFAMQPMEGRYLFGRVISVEAKWTLSEGAGSAVLLYIYRERSTSKAVPDASALRVDQLLVPPIMTNRLPWSRGYFENVAHVPLESGDILPQHCFRYYTRGKYFDEHGRELLGPTEPVGEFALDSFRTIDDQVSDALGIPRVPEDA